MEKLLFNLFYILSLLFKIIFQSQLVNVCKSFLSVPSMFQIHCSIINYYMNIRKQANTKRECKHKQTHSHCDIFIRSSINLFLSDIKHITICACLSIKSKWLFCWSNNYLLWQLVIPCISLCMFFQLTYCFNNVIYVFAPLVFE